MTTTPTSSFPFIFLLFLTAAIAMACTCPVPAQPGSPGFDNGESFIGDPGMEQFQGDWNGEAGNGNEDNGQGRRERGRGGRGRGGRGVDPGTPDGSGDNGQGDQGGRRREHERVINLGEALEGAGATDPIKLNQPGFVTEDQVRLRGTFFKGKADESTPPVILLHELKSGKRDDWEEFGKKLAEQGMAVLIPDLRGHGESTQAMIEDFSQGGGMPAPRGNEYKVENFSEEDMEAMANYDWELWFSFLMSLNNEKKLNIRKLVIVSVGGSCEVAMRWIMNDWMATTPKKGRLTRGCIMISPERTANGKSTVYTAGGASRAKAGSVQYEILVGEMDEDALKNATNAGLDLAKEKSGVPEGDRKVKLVKFKTRKEGMPLFQVESFKIPDTVMETIKKFSDADPAPKWQQFKHYLEEN